MRAMKALASCIVVALCTVIPAADAQTVVTAREAELAVPFGSAKGHVAVAGNQLVFISQDNPDMSVAIDRADIRNFERTGDTVTITTRNSLRDRSGSRDTFRFRLSQSDDLQAWYDKAPRSAGPSTASAPAAAASDVLSSYQVIHDHRIGSCQGRLILMNDRLGYESIDEIDDSRQWMLADLKEVKQSGIYKLKVEPFIGDTFNFELAGKGMDSGEYRRLVDRIAKARSAR